MRQLVLQKKSHQYNQIKILDNFLFRKYEEKADNQLLLIEDRKIRIRKNLYMMHYAYLTRLRAEIFNFINKAINTLKEEYNTETNLSKKEIKLLLNNEINPLIIERMPFITIEQLTLINYFDLNNSLTANDIPENELDLDFNTFYKKDNKTHPLNIYPTCLYYDFSEGYDLNSSIDLDNFNIENENLFDPESLTENRSNDLLDKENKRNETLINFNDLNDSFNFKNSRFSEKTTNLLDWSECLDLSLSLQLKKITSDVNNILFLRKIIKKNISDQFLEYISENNFLISNPFPFINLFDLNKDEFINFDKFEENKDFSNIYFFNLNITEIEFFDMNLNLIRNKITDLKDQLNLLTKKEKYWNNKKLYTKTNKSIINKI